MVRENIFARTRAIIRANLPHLEAWIREQGDVFTYARPVAGGGGAALPRDAAARFHRTPVPDLQAPRAGARRAEGNPQVERRRLQRGGRRRLPVRHRHPPQLSHAVEIPRRAGRSQRAVAMRRWHGGGGGRGDHRPPPARLPRHRPADHFHQQGRRLHRDDHRGVVSERRQATAAGDRGPDAGGDPFRHRHPAIPDDHAARRKDGGVAGGAGEGGPEKLRREDVRGRLRGGGHGPAGGGPPGHEDLRRGRLEARGQPDGDRRLRCLQAGPRRAGHRAGAGAGGGTLSFQLPDGHRHHQQHQPAAVHRRGEDHRCHHLPAGRRRRSSR